MASWNLGKSNWKYFQIQNNNKKKIIKKIWHHTTWICTTTTPPSFILHHHHPLAITVSFLCILKSNFLQSVEIGSKCDANYSFFTAGFNPMHRGKGEGHRGLVGTSWHWNCSNLPNIEGHFKVPSESFFPKNFKTRLTFWHMWFFYFQNLVRSCQHIGGTLCILYTVFAPQ